MMGVVVAMMLVMRKTRIMIWGGGSGDGGADGHGKWYHSHNVIDNLQTCFRVLQ